MRRTVDDPTLGGSLRPRGPIQFGLSARELTGATVVEVTGEVDILTAPKLASWMDDLIRRGEGDVVIDLSHTDFIDSLGLHTLLNLRRRLSRQSRSMCVILGAGPVRHAVALARLEEALGVVSSLEDYQLMRSARSG